MQRTLRKLTDAEVNLVAFLLVAGKVDRDYSKPLYTQSLLEKFPTLTYESMQKLEKRYVVREHFLPEEFLINRPQLSSMYQALDSGAIRGIIEHIDKHVLHTDTEIAEGTPRKVLLENLQKRLKRSKNITIPKALPLSFTALNFSLRDIYMVADIFCMLYGGEFSIIPFPSATATAPERWQGASHRARQVVLLLASAPPLEWDFKPKNEIACEIFQWEDGMKMAVDAYKITWQAYAWLRAHPPSTAMQALSDTEAEEDYFLSNKGCWRKRAFKKIRSIFRRFEKYQCRLEKYKDCERYMGNKLNIKYWAMQALHALAHCAMSEEEYNPAIEMCTLIEKHSRHTPSVQIETLYNRVLCHMEIKEREKAIRIAKKALSNAYSYTEPFENQTQLMNFHLLNEGRTFLRLGERVALERLTKKLCEKFIWNEFAPLKLFEPEERTVRLESLESRKRLRDAGESRTTLDRVLSHYCAENGKAWTGSACQGKVIAAMCFVLLADVFQPDPKCKIAHYLFPCRWREVPLDFGTPQFMALRDSKIEETLERIAGMSEDTIQDEVIRQFEKYMDKGYGRLYPGYDCDPLMNIARALVRQGALLHLLHFFLLEGTIKGIPDVWMWTEHTNRREIPELKCITVKAVGESLSDDQRAWLHVLHKMGIRAEVCRVIPNENENTMQDHAESEEEVSDSALKIEIEDDSSMNFGEPDEEFSEEFDEDLTDDESSSDSAKPFDGPFYKKTERNYLEEDASDYASSSDFEEDTSDFASSSDLEEDKVDCAKSSNGAVHAERKHEGRANVGEPDEESSEDYETTDYTSTSSSD